MRHIIYLLLILPLIAQAEINFISLKHRNAETLIPLLQPVVDEGIKISGTGPTLIVNSLPWQLTEIRQIVQELDTPLQSLLISVRQEKEKKSKVIRGDVSGTVEKPKIKIFGTSKNGRDRVSQQLRVIEGEWATIRAGESIPVVTQTVIDGVSQQAIEYKDIDSGFEVRPLLRGESITLTIKPFRAKRSLNGGGLVQQQELHTTVTGQLGQWIELGGADESHHYSGSGTVYITGKSRNLTHNVSVMVERLAQ